MADFEALESGKCSSGYYDGYFGAGASQEDWHFPLTMTWAFFPFFDIAFKTAPSFTESFKNRNPSELMGAAYAIASVEADFAVGSIFARPQRLLKLRQRITRCKNSGLGVWMSITKICLFNGSIFFLISFDGTTK